MRMYSQLATQVAISDFVFAVFFHRAPKQSAAFAPAIEDDSIKKRLVSCGHDQTIILIRFFRVGSAPVKDEGLEMKLFQARSDIAGVVSTNPALFCANLNQKIVDSRVPGNAV